MSDSKANQQLEHSTNLIKKLDNKITDLERSNNLLKLKVTSNTSEQIPEISNHQNQKTAATTYKTQIHIMAERLRNMEMDIMKNRIHQLEHQQANTTMSAAILTQLQQHQPMYQHHRHMYYHHQPVYMYQHPPVNPNHGLPRFPPPPAMYNPGYWGQPPPVPAPVADPHWQTAPQPLVTLLHK